MKNDKTKEVICQDCGEDFTTTEQNVVVCTECLSPNVLVVEEW